MERKIKFSDLNVWLKIAIIVSYITGTLYLIGFLIGFIKGMLTYGQ